MAPSSLALEKSELPIRYETGFHVPIHPKFLDPNTALDPGLAREVFEQAGIEWYKDLLDYRKTAELDPETAAWYDRVFLTQPPRFERELCDISMKPVGWHDHVLTSDNGFASGFSISRNAGGSIYFTQGDMGCQEFVPFEISPTSRALLLLPPNKVRSYGYRDMDLGKSGKGMIVNVYAHHNVDNFPGALFLRNWGRLYINKALESLGIT